MKKTFLFPHWCQKTGWWLLVALVVFLVLMDSGWGIQCSDRMGCSLFSVPFLSLVLFLVCLSQEKLEDEYISHIRARSVFVVGAFAFVISLINLPVKLLGARLWSPEQMGAYLMHVQYLTNPLVLAMLYLILFKGTLFLNWLKTRNSDGQ